MAIDELNFPSSNGRDTIHAWLYEPVRPPRAVVQLIHGLGEHSRRYLRLITRLLDEGFVVVADDHAGHGKTAMASGVWTDAGDDAANVVVADEETLAAQVRERYPELPFVVFGHSWGSMIARGLAARQGDRLDGLILCGVAAQLHGIEQVLDRSALAAEPDPEAVADAYVGQVFDGFVARFGKAPGPTDWVARDPGVVADHARDRFNNFGAPMTIRFLRGFVELYDSVNAVSWYDAIRPDLPLLVLAGDQDPVANYGEGAYHVANRLVASGHSDVRTRVYTGYRHEVHNEPEIRDEVAAEIAGFVDRILTQNTPASD
ncbi:alpha/beta fold hydrolase [Flexivirga caeni]|uniref:Alpha/beta hydrolase n=1 Tax=Flexivirga caeni TaxID=2294115 RepID=A0A3M9LUB8_9MICO|nr:alpha/beta hydrolase [Flexivirga caeni]RNI16926.1 alpha/beta hydrolase [Flexivirga caeni]